MNFDKLLCWLCRKSFRVLQPETDYSIKRGDTVRHPGWPYSDLEVIDVNWALSAIAVRLGPDGGIVVWPSWRFEKVTS